MIAETCSSTAVHIDKSNMCVTTLFLLWRWVSVKYRKSLFQINNFVSYSAEIAKKKLLLRKLLNEIC
jgi:hypothetical protein